MTKVEPFLLGIDKIRRRDPLSNRRSANLGSEAKVPKISLSKAR